MPGPVPNLNLNTLGNTIGYSSGYGSGAPRLTHSARFGNAPTMGTSMAPKQQDGNRGGYTPRTDGERRPRHPNHRVDGRTLALDNNLNRSTFGTSWINKAEERGPTYTKARRASYVGSLPYDRTTWIGANDPDHFTYRPKRWTADEESYINATPGRDQRAAVGLPGFKQGKSGYW